MDCVVLLAEICEAPPEERSRSYSDFEMQVSRNIRGHRGSFIVTYGAIMFCKSELARIYSVDVSFLVDCPIAYLNYVNEVMIYPIFRHMLKNLLTRYTRKYQIQLNGLAGFYNSETDED